MKNLKTLTLSIQIYKLYITPQTMKKCKKYKNNQKHIDRCGFCYFYYFCYKDEIDSQILNYTAKYLPAPFL
jgi:hypothetical protein